MPWFDGWFGKKVGTITKRLEFVDGDYTSKNVDGSRDYSWGWYPAKDDGSDPDANGWVATGRTRWKHGRHEHERCAGVWFGKEIKYWFFKDDDGKIYHADPP